jgi:squalene-associated FAD-dependent desaturase
MKTAIIGAGWAGCAAAVTLVRLGHRVCIYETAAIPGGRARRVLRSGLPIDNGQHLLIGAYTHTRNLVAAVHGGDGEAQWVRSALSIGPLADGARGLRLHVPHLPGRLGLLFGIVAARGMTLRDRLALVNWWNRLSRRDFSCRADATAATLLASGPAVAARELWGPLCLAALNTPVQRASGQVFANVLRAAFQSARASDFLFPSMDLSALFPDAAVRFVEANGGTVVLKTRASIAAIADDCVVVTASSQDRRFDGVVIAVGPHQFESVASAHPPLVDAVAAAQALAYEPIATVWLGYGERVLMRSTLARLDDAPGQWIVDRSEVLAKAEPDRDRPPLSSLVAVVISASGPHEAMSPDALAAACDAQLRRLVPGWPPLAWSQTIVEQRATYACTPGRPRPASARPHPRVALAGDWMDEELPATIEGAVRTGVSAAFTLANTRLHPPLP